MVKIVSDWDYITAFLPDNSYLEWPKFSYTIHICNEAGRIVKMSTIHPLKTNPSMLDFTVFVQNYIEGNVK